jgi:hypothetical protein
MKHEQGDVLLLSGFYGMLYRLYRFPNATRNTTARITAAQEAQLSHS